MCHVTARKDQLVSQRMVNPLTVVMRNIRRRVRVNGIRVGVGEDPSGYARTVQPGPIALALATRLSTQLPNATSGK